MPPRESAAEYRYHKILANVIEDVLRRPSGRVKVTELADSAGFSRFHLTRLFRDSAEETMEQFLRRIRLERSAYMLLHSNQRVSKIASDSGYRSPEAFSRAFRRAYGCLPSAAPDKLLDWELRVASDLHWNADWVLTDSESELGERPVFVPTRHALLLRVSGDYSSLEEAWKRLESHFGTAIPRDATFVSIYQDNLWTHPVGRTMRADIGWLCSPSDQPPRGMRLAMIQGGGYMVTPFIERASRTSAWSHMWGEYTPAREERPGWIAYDEYSGWPVPLENVRTRILVQMKTQFSDRSDYPQQSDSSLNQVKKCDSLPC